MTERTEGAYVSLTMAASTGAVGTTSQKGARHDGVKQKKIKAVRHHGNQHVASDFPAARVVALAQAGLSDNSIAKVVGFNQSTVSRFLQRMAPELAGVKAFTDSRADIFRTVQIKALDIQDRILATLDDDGVLAALSPKEKSVLMEATNRIAGTFYDKERLETGKSTQNHSLIARMMGDALDSAHHAPTSSETSKPDAQA